MRNLDKTLSDKENLKILVGLTLSLQKQIKEYNRQIKFLETDKSDLYTANRNLFLTNQQLTEKIDRLEGRTGKLSLVKKSNAA